MPALRAARLKCEYLDDPLGIDVRLPRLSWQVETAPGPAGAVVSRGRAQSAYRILVAATLEELSAGGGRVWDSGRVAGSGSTTVTYAGRPLAAGERCWWAVRVWDEAGNEGPWSGAARFEIGLLEPSDWAADWISAPDAAIPSPFLRKEFALPAPVQRARAHVSGLGGYELYLNGAKVRNRVLYPAPTYFHNDHEPELKDRVLYSSYDVTGLLQQGANAVGVFQAAAN